MFGLGTIGNLVVKVTADTKGFSNKLGGLSKTTKILGGAIAGAFSLAAIGMLAKGSIALAKRGAEVEGVTKAFEGLTDELEGGSKKWITALKKGSLGMVDQITLMKSFNNAAQLIGKDFAQTLPDAMQYFTKISASTGESVDYLMDSYVRGIGRLSPMIIDNLKIQVSQAEATAKAAEMFGVAEGALSKYQIQMGMASVVTDKLAESTKDLPEVVGSAAQSFAKFQATMTDLKDRLAVTILPLFTKIAEGLLEAFDDPAVIAGIENIFTWLGNLVGNADSGLLGILATLTTHGWEGLWKKALGYDMSVIVDGTMRSFRDAEKAIETAEQTQTDFQTSIEKTTTLLGLQASEFKDDMKALKDALPGIYASIIYGQEKIGAAMKVVAMTIKYALYTMFKSTADEIFKLQVSIQNAIVSVVDSLNALGLDLKRPTFEIPAYIIQFGILAGQALADLILAQAELALLKPPATNELPAIKRVGLGRQAVVYNNYGIDLSNEGRAQELLNPFIEEGVRSFG